MPLEKERLYTLLKTHFGYDSFRESQLDIIQSILAGEDTVVIMPTGGGKSLCFQLPALALEGTALVISPLIALMKDQVDALRANGVNAAYYNSTQPQEEIQQVIEALQQGHLDLIYVAPESLSLLDSTLQNCRLSLIAIDEAHCISSWGHDFRPAYTRLGHFKKQYPDVPLIALTATADTSTQDDIAEQLSIPNAKRYVSSFDRPNLFLDIRPGQDRVKQILKFLDAHPFESGIIYCLSRKSTEQLAEKLRASGYTAKAYHAGMTAIDRSHVQEEFVSDKTPIIVATIAFGMGIDKSNVRWVIHYNMPKNIEGYYQEIGRAGRDGLPSHTLLFYSYADIIQLRKFIEGSTNEDYQIAKLERMQQYAEALSCRRKALLNYFGEFQIKDCGHCDICTNRPEYFDGTELAQKVLSAIARLKEQEALGMVIDVLRGAQNAQVYNKGYQHIKTYGALKNVAWRDLQQYTIQMINQGLLEIRFRESGRLVLTTLAKDVLFKNTTVQLATLIQPITEIKKERKPSKPKGTLFEKLRELRNELARDENIPAYIIFSDASLKDMEDQEPLTKAEFLEINGVGQAKLERYATDFIKVIKAHKTPIKTKGKTYDATRLLLEEGRTIEEIAQHRELSIGTIYNHIIKLYESGVPLDFYTHISQEEVAQITNAKTKVTDPELLKSYFDFFEEKIPYWKIKMGLYLEAL